METCTGPECGRKILSRQLCSTHYEQMRRRGFLTPIGSSGRRVSGAALVRDELGRKQCASCRDWLDEKSFSRLDESRSKDGLNHTCRTCYKFRQIKHNYNLTREQYEALLEEQGGGCAICGEVSSHGKYSLCVDHDHSCCPGERSCGECVRALLCNRHNIVLGHVRDNPEELRSIIRYLQAHL